jgi:hypothetical protein
VGATPPAATAGGDSGWKEINRRVKRGMMRRGRADARLVKGALPPLQPLCGLSERFSFRGKDNSKDLQC